MGSWTVTNSNPIGDGRVEQTTTLPVPVDEQPEYKEYKNPRKTYDIRENLYDHECEHCGVKFQDHSWGTKWCARPECQAAKERAAIQKRKEWYKKRQQAKPARRCEHCGAELLSTAPSRTRYCDKPECQDYKAKTTKIMMACNACIAKKAPLCPRTVKLAQELNFDLSKYIKRGLKLGTGEATPHTCRACGAVLENAKANYCQKPECQAFARRYHNILSKISYYTGRSTPIPEELVEEAKEAHIDLQVYVEKGLVLPGEKPATAAEQPATVAVSAPTNSTTKVQYKALAKKIFDLVNTLQSLVGESITKLAIEELLNKELGE